MTEAIHRGDNPLRRPQLLPVAEREAIQAQIARAAADFQKFIKSKAGRKIISQIPPDIAIPLGQSYRLTNEGLVWDNHCIVGGNFLERFIPVPPTHYQAVVRAFALTQEELNPEATIPHIKNCLSAYTKTK